MELLRKTALFKLEQQTKGIPEEDVKILCFSTVPLVPVNLLTPFRHLEKLFLVAMKPALTSFSQVMFAVVALPKLRLLDLSDNRIGDDVAELVAVATSNAHEDTKQVRPLTRLALANNQVASNETLRVLASLFPVIEVLDISQNPIVDDDARPGSEGAVRTLCFTTLWPSSLVAVDGKSADGEAMDVLDSDEDEDSENDDDSASDTDDDGFFSDEEEEDEEDSEGVDDSSADGEPVAKQARKE